MGSKQTILRIRCDEKTFRDFKRISVDYESYEKALLSIINNHQNFLQLYPNYEKTTTEKSGKYASK